MLSMQWLQQIPHETLYIVFSELVAVIIWFEGITLRRTQGEMPSSTLFHIGSLIDTLWFFVSLGCMYYLEFQSIAMVVPIAYAIYKVFGLFYGTSLLSEQGIPDTPEDLIIPMKLVDYTQSFALIFFALCAFVLAFPTLPFAVPFSLPF